MNNEFPFTYNINNNTSSGYFINIKLQVEKQNQIVLEKSK